MTGTRNDRIWSWGLCHEPMLPPVIAPRLRHLLGPSQPQSAHETGSSVRLLSGQFPAPQSNNKSSGIRAPSTLSGIGERAIRMGRRVHVLEQPPRDGLLVVHGLRRDGEPGEEGVSA